MKRIKSSIVNLRILKKFHFGREMYCVEAMARKYCGLSMSTRRVEGWYNRIQAKFVMQAKLSKIGIYLIQLHRQLISECRR